MARKKSTDENTEKPKKKKETTKKTATKKSNSTNAVIPSPFEVIKQMMLNNGVFETYISSPLVASRNLFMINRTCAIAYPLHAQYFNILGISPKEVLISWRAFLQRQYGVGRTPGFVFTKGGKAVNAEKDKKSLFAEFSRDFINDYCSFYNISKKDFQDMLEFTPGTLYQHIKEFENNTVKFSENITKNQ